jgi:pimeloyl-ACP methyl ester carboxylesterase
MGKKIFWAVIIVIIAALFYLYKSDIPLEELKKQYTNEQSKFINIDGVSVHYRDEGNKNDSIPLVLIHGTSSSLHTWDSIVPALLNKKRIIRLDIPAFGLTGPHPGRDYSIAFYNQFIDSFLSTIGVQQYIIAGNSLGGSIAWNQALSYPQKVKQLILINSGGYPKKNEKGNIGFKLASTPVVGDVLLKFTPRGIIRKSVEDVYSDKAKVNEVLVQRYFDLLLREGNRNATLDIFKQRIIFGSSERIKNIKTPTLIIWGEDDQLIDVSNAYLFEKDIQYMETKLSYAEFPFLKELGIEEVNFGVYRSGEWVGHGP